MVGGWAAGEALPWELVDWDWGAVPVGMDWDEGTQAGRSLDPEGTVMDGGILWNWVWGRDEWGCYIGLCFQIDCQSQLEDAIVG